MRIICVEEHTIDSEMAAATAPALLREAPYISVQQNTDAPWPRGSGHLTSVSMPEAAELAVDLGEGRIKEMDAQGIDTQVLSYSTPAHLLPADQGVAFARAANDRLAEAVRAHPDRLSGFAVLPWQDPRAAAAELDRSVGELGLKGALIAGRPGATFLDDARYAPVLKKLSDLGVPLYVHPYHPVPQVQEAYYAGFAPEVSAWLSLGAWGWHHEAGVHVLRLILSGAFETHPGLQVISGHWGEMVPFYLSRLDDALPPRATGLSSTITETYRDHVWVTPSGVGGLPHFEFIHKVVGADRIIWSTDYPYLAMDGTRAFVEKLPVAQEDREKMAHLNAEKLLRL
ncbi:amidohydrolase family protein [Streptomyces sp. NRRL F-5126]|uniref:amidohydrolase family protein n=1 Tax=Streptomyces sp. NRRL F-5126 TaxID=1463857 RepID=UPI0004C57152|nr:amidohydrolase family protein [Streptomyces sp. NRRL F-5126]